MQDLLMLWDAIFSDGISFDLVDYVFVAMLLYIKDASQWPSLSCFSHGACIRGFYRVSRYVSVFFFCLLATLMSGEAGAMKTLPASFADNWRRLLGRLLIKWLKTIIALLCIVSQKTPPPFHVLNNSANNVCHILQLQQLCASRTAGVQPRPQPKPALVDFGLQPYIAVVCHLMVSTPEIHGLQITWITSYLLTPEGWKAELA